MKTPARSFVKVFYKCRCMQDERAVQVPFRDASQDVVEWMEEVVAEVVTRDHAARSPLCMATKLEYLKIPAPDNAPFLGGKPKLDG